MRPSPATEIQRRAFLGATGLGLGSLALSSIARAGASPPSWPARCKRVIFLCMAGGPSHLETFDHKPELANLHGQPMPKSFTEGQQIAQLQGKANELKVLGPQHEFARHGKSGQKIASVLPHIASKIADDICIVRSMQTEQINQTQRTPS